MQQVVNQIYWAPTFDAAFGFGSVIRRQADGTVTFSNPFMTSGIPIINWTVSGNFQATKTVPQLPHLRLGHEYRLVLHGVQKPRNTIIIRLTFFDIQWQKLKRYDFTNQSVYFTVPNDTVNYSLELINAGNQKLIFRRIEICENNLPADANDDLWFQKRWHSKSLRPLVLLIVPAGIRAKKTYPQLKRYVGRFKQPIQVLTVSKQYHGNLSKDILDWLNHERQYHATLVSCDSKMDDVVLRAQAKLPSLKTLVTDRAKYHLNDFDSHSFRLQHKYDWQNENITDPDWKFIFESIYDTFGGE